MVDKKEVEYVARLANIEITDEESKDLKSQLSKIIDYIDKLKKLDTEGVEPMRGLYKRRNFFREDKVRVSVTREDILKNAPSCEKEYFKVPKVIN